MSHGIYIGYLIADVFYCENSVFMLYCTIYTISADEMWKKSIRSSTYAYMRLSGHSPQESDKVALETDKEERKEFFIS